MAKPRKKFGYNRIVIEMLGDDPNAPPLSDVDAFNEMIANVTRSMDKKAYVYPLRCWDGSDPVWILEIEDAGALRHDVERVVRGVLPLVDECDVDVIALDEANDREIRFSFADGDSYREVDVVTGKIRNAPWHEALSA